MTMKWDNLPVQAQKDLLEWLNSSIPTRADKRRLAKLYYDGLFHAWDCPTCGDRVYHGEPENWDHFQGVHEMDFSSYPGWNKIFTQEIIEKQCDHCRCHLNPTHGDWVTHDDTGIE
jgi:hypothetical protein